jgi:hypothetical protein
MAENLSPQRDQDVVTYEAFTGLRNEVTPERFTPADLSHADNVDLDKTGRLSRRKGYASVLAGSMHSLWADDQQEICLFAQGNQLNQLSTTYSVVPVATLQGVGNPVSYQRVSDRVYYNNGVDTGILENGAVRSWGMAPPSIPGAVATVGAMPAGTYQYSLTYLRGDGQESGAALAGVVTVPDVSGLAFVLPASADPGVVTKALYLSTPDGEVLYLAALIPAATTQYTYTGDTLELNLPLATQFMGSAPAGQLIAHYRGWMFVAVGDTLYASQPYAYELFDLREYLQLDGQITLLAPMVDKEMLDGAGRSSGFFIGTDRSCGVLVGNDPKDFQYVPKTAYGAIAGALDYVDGSLFGDDTSGGRDLPMWLSTQGVCIGMPDMQVKNLTRSKFGFTATGQGAALFQPGPNRFIATYNL